MKLRNLSSLIGTALCFFDIMYTQILFHNFPLISRVWTPEEDDAIRHLVAKYGTKTWSIIAEQIVKEFGIEGRTGKQCRERWHNHLGTIISISFSNLAVDSFCCLYHFCA